MIERLTPGLRRAVVDRAGASERADALALAYFLGLAGLVLVPLFRPGFILSLDVVFSPNLEFVRYLFSAKDPLYYGRLPVAIVLDGIALVVPVWIVQRGIVVGIIAGSGLSMYLASRTRTTAGALFAGTLYAINPFVYVRLLAGHWWLLAGYAVLPLAVASFADAIAGRGRVRRAAAWATVASAFDPHVAVLLAVAYVCIGSAAIVQRPDRRSVGRRVAERTSRVAAVAVAFNAYWLLPALATVLAGGSKVTAMSGLDLVAFTARGTVDGNVPLSIASLFGFWRGGSRLPLEVLPWAAWLGLFSTLLLLAFVGWYDRRDQPVAGGMLLVGLAGFVLGLGVSVDATAPLFRALYDHAVVFRGMRDSQKFVALLALAYAALGGGGVDRLVRWLEEAVPGEDHPDRPFVLGPGATLPDRGTALRALVIVLVLSTPLVYTWPMLWGLSGQVSATDYPDGWAEANDLLLEDESEYRVLFLPWHQYMTFPWTDGRVASPADAYFERPVIRSRSIDIAGIDSQAASPAHARVTALLEEPGTPEPIGPELAGLGVKYVIVAKAADYRRYDYLRHQSDLAVATENGDLVVYENRAFGAAAAPDRWPRAAPVVPGRALIVGAIVSAVAVAVAFVPSGSLTSRGTWGTSFRPRR